MRRAAVTAAVLALGLALAACSDSGVLSGTTSSSVSSIPSPSSDPSPPQPQLAPPPAASTKKTPSPTVETIARCHDGDTCTTAGGENIRLLGINAPEVSPVECYGKEATAAIQARLTGEIVTLQADPSQGDKDRYGRLLRYIVTADGVDTSEWLVLNGFAKVYEQYPVSRTPAYQAAQVSADNQDIGGWAAATDGGCGWPS